MKRYRAASSGDTGAQLGGLLRVLLALLLVIASVSFVLSAAAAALGAELAVGLLLPLAVVVPAAAAVLLALGPVKLPFIAGARPEIEPEELTGEELRQAFRRMLDYRDGMRETAREVGDGELGRALRDVLRQSDESLSTLFCLAKQIADPRQSRLLRGDLFHLRAKREQLTELEREQLASLERLDEVTRLVRRHVDDTQAILGRCYAQGREIALVHNLTDVETQHLMAQLREQPILLGHLTGALKEVYGPLLSPPHSSEGST